MNDLPDLKPKIVLAVGAHPDDLDVTCSGTIAKWAAEGAECHFLVVTNGNKGSDDINITSAELIKIRHGEQRKAAKIIGVKEVTFFDYEDGELEVTQQLKKDISRHIRKVCPDVVISMDPTFVYRLGGFINHTDHRAAGQATMDAVYPLARDRLTYPDLLEEGYEPHKVPHLLLTTFGDGNYFVDISDTMNKKLAALAAHASQFGDIDVNDNRIAKFGSEIGKKIGVKYAESFNRIDMFI